MLCVHSLPSSLLVFLPAVQTQPELLSYISLAPHSLFFRSYLWEKSTLSRGRMNGGRREVAVVRGGIFCGPDSFCRGPVHCNNVLCHDHDKPWTLPGARERAPTPLKFSLSLSPLCLPHGQGNRTCRYPRRTRFAFSRQYSCLVTTTPSRAASCDPVFRAKFAAEWKADTFTEHFSFIFLFWKDRVICLGWES